MGAVDEYLKKMKGSRKRNPPAPRAVGVLAAPNRGKKEAAVREFIEETFKVMEWTNKTVHIPGFPYHKWRFPDLYCYIKIGGKTYVLLIEVDEHQHKYGSWYADEVTRLMEMSLGWGGLPMIVLRFNTDNRHRGIRSGYGEPDWDGRLQTLADTIRGYIREPPSGMVQGDILVQTLFYDVEQIQRYNNSTLLLRGEGRSRGDTEVMEDVEAGDEETEVVEDTDEDEKMEVPEELTHADHIGDARRVMDEHWMETDGNCQFRALAHHLLGNQDEHHVVRAAVAARLIDTRPQYENPEFWALGVLPAELVNYNEYVEGMTRSGEWGDDITLQVASDIYNVSINVVTSHGHDVIQPRNQDTEPGRTRWLLYERNHYNALTPTGERGPGAGAGANPTPARDQQPPDQQPPDRGQRSRVAQPSPSPPLATEWRRNDVEEGDEETEVVEEADDEEEMEEEETDEEEEMEEDETEEETEVVEDVEAGDEETEVVEETDEEKEEMEEETDEEMEDEMEDETDEEEEEEESVRRAGSKRPRRQAAVRRGAERRPPLQRLLLLLQQQQIQLLQLLQGTIIN